MIETLRPDVLTQSTLFQDVSVSCNLFSKAEIRQFGAARTERLKGDSRYTDLTLIAFSYVNYILVLLPHRKVLPRMGALQLNGQGDQEDQLERAEDRNGNSSDEFSRNFTKTSVNKDSYTTLISEIPQDFDCKQNKSDSKSL